jgi:hypothetical protein
MVNLISSEPKTGCYLLLILSNLQAPIFKNNARNPSFPVRLLGPLGPLARRHAHTPPLLAPGLRILAPGSFPICFFPPDAAC